MKQLLLIIICISLYSCRKCTQCTDVMMTDAHYYTKNGMQQVPGYPEKTVTSYQFCGTGKEIREHDAKQTSATHDENGIQIRVSQTTSCNPPN